MAFETIDIKNISGLQSITIPENFKINDEKVYLKKVGNVIYIIPFHNPWQSLFESVNEFTPDYMEKRDQFEIQQKRDAID